MDTIKQRRIKIMDIWCESLIHWNHFVGRSNFPGEQKDLKAFLDVIMNENRNWKIDNEPYL